MRIVHISESAFEYYGLAERKRRDEQDVLDSLIKKVDDSVSKDNLEIISIQYVHHNKMTGYIEYGGRDVRIDSNLSGISAYVTVR